MSQTVSDPATSQIAVEQTQPAQTYASAESIKDANLAATITEYDLFTFETRMRESITEALSPYLIAANTDRHRVVSTHLHIVDLQ